MKIGFAGIGGIGSNVALFLARLGVDNKQINHFKIIDFDRVEQTNLNRQFYFIDQIGQNKTDALYNNLLRINSNLVVEKVQTLIDKQNIIDVIGDCDIIVEGFDKSEYKRLLVETFGNSDKLVVSASGISDYDIDNITIKKVGKKCFVVGDFSKDNHDYKLFSTKISIVAAMMTDIILQKGGFL